MLIRTALLITIAAFSQWSFAAPKQQEATEEKIHKAGDNYLVEKYNVFSPNNRMYQLVLNDQNSDKKLIFEKKQQSDIVHVFASNLNKSHYVTRPISGKIQIRFGDDDKLFDLTTSRHYIRPTLTRLSKDKDEDLFQRFQSKKVMYVKLNVLGKEHLLTVNLDESGQLLEIGTFL
ncbi:hypothetical protein ACFFUP_00670 [Vibrio ostreicida]|uniref:Uncharacterized protein n=1 Tax=Vibrio ostreicida TaxID=526588 RepID=A0ABT8BTU9_9VIBR|nr:hypothetical protein [Vibrio ostreicida]MDN3610182.1 hypothetical protein [Vibrio ostreicida]NPD07797.1 hypothetical protein [Vibrio ostreicida]